MFVRNTCNFYDFNHIKGKDMNMDLLLWCVVSQIIDGAFKEVVG